LSCQRYGGLGLSDARAKLRAQHLTDISVALWGGTETQQYWAWAIPIHHIRSQPDSIFYPTVRRILTEIASHNFCIHMPPPITDPIQLYGLNFTDDQVYKISAGNVTYDPDLIFRVCTLPESGQLQDLTSRQWHFQKNSTSQQLPQPSVSDSIEFGSNYQRRSPYGHATRDSYLIPRFAMGRQGQNNPTRITIALSQRLLAHSGIEVVDCMSSTQRSHYRLSPEAIRMSSNAAEMVILATSIPRSCIVSHALTEPICDGIPSGQFTAKPFPFLTSLPYTHILT